MMKKHVWGKFAATVFAVILAAGLFSFPDANAAEKKLTSEEIDSSYGFFVWLSQNADTRAERKDAQIAAQILTNTIDEELKEQIFNDGSLSAHAAADVSYEEMVALTHLGQVDSEGEDATTLDSLRESLDYIKLGNTYRAKENLPALTVSSGLMAMGELDANYCKSIKGIKHPLVFNALENLAFKRMGSTGPAPDITGDDPYEGWYTKEKALYDAGNIDAAGHYMTLTDRNNNIAMVRTGYGISHAFYQKTKEGETYNYHDKYHSQQFSDASRFYPYGANTTPDKYIAYIERYMSLDECDINGHDLEYVKGKAATCTEDGHIDYYQCTVCKKKFADAEAAKEIKEEDIVIPALDHDWYEGTPGTEPTCTEAGHHYYSCNRCGKKKTETIPALGHKEEKLPGKEATCTEAGLTEGIRCSVCKEILKAQEEIPALDHDWYEGTAGTEPTCTEAGHHYYSCNRCGKKKTETIPALGHNWDEGLITKEATTEEEGEKTFTCQICGATKTEIIPKVKPEKPQEETSSTEKPEETTQAAEPDTASGKDSYVPKGSPNVAKAEKAIKAVSDKGEPKGASFGKLMARVSKATKNSIKLKWKKVPGASGYIIYGNRCGTSYKYRKLTTVKGKTWSQKKLKKGTYYKYIVIAYRNTSEGQFVIATSKSIHGITKGNKKYTVAKGLKLSKTKVSLKKGKKYKLTAKEIPLVKKRKIQHHRKVAFESSNKKVATVNSSGKITGKAKGACKIYVYAQNGVFKTVTVKVK